MTDTNEDREILSREDRLARRARMVEYVRLGHDYNETARQFGVSRALVYEVCKEAGIRPLPTLRGQDRTLRILADLIQTGDTLAKIGERHGTSTTWVHSILERARTAGIAFPLRREYHTTKRKGDQWKSPRRTSGTSA